MTAEILRRAASLMRERATAAAKDAPPPWLADKPWSPGQETEVRDVERNSIAYSESGHNASMDATVAPHVASWHPAVALAVADWLDAAAKYPRQSSQALAVARAYLGSDA
jgi:hypothetical protein